MNRDGSVAPKERVNITYKPATGDAREEVELPLRILCIGDYSGRSSGALVEERDVVNIDKDNFDDVLASQSLSLDINVSDRLSPESDGDRAVRLKFDSLRDFGPDNIVTQVPELRRLTELRGALTSLKGPLGNIPTFRKKIQNLLQDQNSRQRLIRELGIGKEEE